MPTRSGTRSRQATARRRLRTALVALCALACAAGTAAPAGAAPPPSPSPVPTPTWFPPGSTPAGPGDPTPVTVTSYAADAEPFSVTVSPARLVVGADGLADDRQMLVVNRGQQPVALTVEKRNFTTAPDGGLSFPPDAPYGAADWVDVSPTRIELQPGRSQQVRVRVDVPEDPDHGDHQVALVFLTSATGPGNIRVNRGIGAPVYVTVPGPVDDSVRLDRLTGPGWVWNGHASLTAELTSTGTVHRDFRRGTALAVGTPDHMGRFADFTVARGASRVVSTVWEPPLVCLCRPAVSVTNAGQGPQTQSATVLVLPWWLPAGLLLALVAALGVVLRHRSRRGRATTTDQPEPTGAADQPAPAGRDGG